MRGFPWIESSPGRWNERRVAEQVRALVVAGVVGGLVGAVTAHVRLNLGWPGHRALFWMVPVIVLRLAGRTAAGATVGSLAAAGGAMAAGGNLAGGGANLAMVGLAGIWLDLAIEWAQRTRLNGPGLVILIGLAGLIANLLCFFKRILDPLVHQGYFSWPRLGFPLLSYAVFGLLAGLAAAVIFLAIVRRTRERDKA